MAGNIVEGYPKVTADNWDGGVQFNKAPDADASGDIAKGVMDDADEIQKIIAQVRVDKPFPMPPMTMQTAQEAYESVLTDAGATLPRRDSVDERAIAEVRTGKVWSEGKEITPEPMKGLAKNNIGTAGNGIITDISQVGGYPEYKGEPIQGSWRGRHSAVVEEEIQAWTSNDPDLARQGFAG